MAKKKVSFRLSEEALTNLDKYAKDHSLANTTEALEQILTNLFSPSSEPPLLNGQEEVPRASDAPDCYYHSKDLLTGKWYCDTREIPPCVCLARHNRFQHFQRNCRPAHLKPKPRRPQQQWTDRTQKKSSDDWDTPYKGATKLWKGEGQHDQHFDFSYDR